MKLRIELNESWYDDFEFYRRDKVMLSQAQGTSGDPIYLTKRSPVSPESDAGRNASGLLVVTANPCYIETHSWLSTAGGATTFRSQLAALVQSGRVKVSLNGVQISADKLAYSTFAEYKEQASGLNATTAAPVADEGVLLDGITGVISFCSLTAGIGDIDIVAWGKIAGVWTALTVPEQATTSKVLPVDWGNTSAFNKLMALDRVYLQITRYASGTWTFGHHTVAAL